MSRRRLLRAGPAALMLASAGTPGSGRAAAVPNEASPLDAALRPLLLSHQLPALAAAVVRDGRLVAAGAVGTRRAGTELPVSLDDRFHIGSDTKAMTSLLAGMLVEEGKLRWDATVGDSFPELATGMDPGLRGVTLVQLLSHTSGIPGDNDVFRSLLERSYAQDEMNLDELRLWLLREWRTQPLQSVPGEHFAYSNLGYTLAGSMIERAAGRTWEELICERIFDPLGLRSAGLGPQASPGRVDAPLGHALRGDGTLKPMLAGPDGDGPPIIGPAGLVHLSIIDFAAWAAWHAAEGRRGPSLARPETVRKLHAPVITMAARPDAAPGTPAQGRYALGWGSLSMPWSPQPLLTHTGSNTLNLAAIWVQPESDFAMVMTTNVSGSKADAALRVLAEQLYRRYGPPTRG